MFAFWQALCTKMFSGARRGKRICENDEGLPVHSFQTLITELASCARVTYTFKPQKEGEKTKEKTNLTNATFKQVAEPTPVQARAYELIRLFPVTES